MSYKKAMKWNKSHRKGIKQMYVGFNTSGITSKEIQEREEKFIQEMKQKTLNERVEYWYKIEKIIKLKLGSWDWTWCTFKRNFVSHTNEII